MIINNQFESVEAAAEAAEIIVNADGSRREAHSRVVREHFMDVYINEQLAVKLVCTPANLVELVMGRMVSERYIDREDDVESIYICNYGSKARVFLKKDAELLRTVENEPTCCTGNQVLLSTGGRELKRLSKAGWKPEWIFDLAQEFAGGSRIHRATQGTHSCYLSVNGKIEYASEDIGRHNAMDKVIGYVVMHDIDRKQCILYTTGRVPTDMVKKVIASGIPVLVSKAVPTDAAIEMAHRYNLTLICKAWPDRYEIFNDAD
ncbi:MAG: formate dehydrogenase accessory sulfurtransferase FdhD [Lachnospiraceae bacterium]|nr:formate dehydrogenase accessory sulfurtransferase FdhD [Lachnospiraceae bacterium]